MEQIRQGDILLVRVEKTVPSRNHQTEIILAEGELTGHAHRLRGTRLVEWSAAGQRYVAVLDAPGRISHEDHDPEPATIDPGVYRVVAQSEWDLRGQWRKVRD